MEDELATLAAFVGGGQRDLDAELVRRTCLALADAFGLGGMPRVELPAALALLLAADLGGPAERHREGLLQALITIDLAPDVPDQTPPAGCAGT